MLRKEKEEQGLKGLRALHQLLSPEGRQLLEQILVKVTFYLNLAVEECRFANNYVKAKREATIEGWLKVMRGQRPLIGIEQTIAKIRARYPEVA